MADSDKNCSRMDPVLAPRDLRITNFPGTFRYGNQHDIHYADTADQQGNRCHNNYKDRDIAQNGVDLGKSDPACSAPGSTLFLSHLCLPSMRVDRALRHLHGFRRRVTQIT